MPLPPRDFNTIGPKEGQRFPDVRLSDQTGALIDLHEQRGGRPALVVFYRSAGWWPFCKTQLVELQQVAPALAAERVSLVAISYESVEILHNFAATHGITYHLLSDEGSHAMRGLSLINDRVQEDHAVYGIKPNARHVKLPYPGVYVLDRDGVVTQKRFYESYRERDTGTGLIAQALGIVTEPSSPPVAANNSPGVTARAWLDSATYVFFQRVLLTLEVSIAPGFHVYGPPAGDGLTPLSIEIDALRGLEVVPARWPSPRRFPQPGFSDELWVHEGVVRGTVPLTFAATPGGGDLVIGVTVRYPAWRGRPAPLPSPLPLGVRGREAALVARSLPSPTAKA